MQLSPDVVRQYQEDGFLFYDQRLLTDADIQEILAVADRVCRGETGLPATNIQLEDNHTLDQAQPTPDNPVRKLTGLSSCLPEIEKFARHPQILDVVESILGPDLKLYSDEFFMKNPARPGQSFRPYEWHQDAAHYRFFAPLDGFVTCWIALDRATTENGCMQFIPQSHTFGPIAIPRRQRFLRSSLLAKPVDAPVEPGCAVFHHGLNFHKSDPNRSTQPRRAIAFHYMRATTIYLGLDDEYVRRIVQCGYLGEDFRFPLMRGKEYAGCV